MSTEPSDIQEQIEQTRARLSSNVDALADQANPAHIAQRAAGKVRRKGSALLDRVLGAAEDARDATVDAAHGLAAACQAPRTGSATRCPVGRVRCGGRRRAIRWPPGWSPSGSGC